MFTALRSTWRPRFGSEGGFHFWPWTMRFAFIASLPPIRDFTGYQPPASPR